MVGPSVIAEIQRRLEPQMWHFNTSTENTRANSSGQL